MGNVMLNLDFKMTVFQIALLLVTVIYSWYPLFEIFFSFDNKLSSKIPIHLLPLITYFLFDALRHSQQFSVMSRCIQG